MLSFLSKACVKAVYYIQRTWGNMLYEMCKHPPPEIWQFYGFLCNCPPRVFSWWLRHHTPRCQGYSLIPRPHPLTRKRTWWLFSWLCQVTSLNSEQANELAHHASVTLANEIALLRFSRWSSVIRLRMHDLSGSFACVVNSRVYIIRGKDP